MKIRVMEKGNKYYLERLVANTKDTWYCVGGGHHSYKYDTREAAEIGLEAEKKKYLELYTLARRIRSGRDL